MCVAARLATAANAPARGPRHCLLPQCDASMHQTLPPTADTVSHNPLTIDAGHSAASQPPCHRRDTLSTDCSGLLLGLNRRGAEARRARRKARRGVAREASCLRSSCRCICAPEQEMPELCSSTHLCGSAVGSRRIDSSRQRAPSLGTIAPWQGGEGPSAVGSTTRGGCRAQPAPACAGRVVAPPSGAARVVTRAVVRRAQHLRARCRALRGGWARAQWRPAGARRRF